MVDVILVIAFIALIFAAWMDMLTGEFCWRVWTWILIATVCGILILASWVFPKEDVAYKEEKLSQTYEIVQMEKDRYYSMSDDGNIVIAIPDGSGFRLKKFALAKDNEILVVREDGVKPNIDIYESEVDHWWSRKTAEDDKVVTKVVITVPENERE